MLNHIVTNLLAMLKNANAASSILANAPFPRVLAGPAEGGHAGLRK